MTTILNGQSNPISSQPNDETTNDPRDGRMSSGNKIVISGMSGLFPNSHNIKELSEILYDKVNPVTKTNWSYNHPEYTRYKGNIPDLEYFDAQFFKVHYRLSANMDPVSRKILEQAYQAIYDAGVNPKSLSGKKVGVFIGASDSETEKFLFYKNSTTGLVLSGCSRTMFANRISYWLNAKGPSLSVDEACCSSTAALEMAYLAIKKGDCVAAIVGGGSTCFHPQTLFNYGRIVNMNTDGKTKSFDKNAAGCTPSEAISVIFLQKAEDALRIYGEVVHAKCEFTSKLNTEMGPKFGFYRNPNDSINFLNTFYKEVNVSPQEVQYVEAFGSATPEADESELETIDNVFCKTRNKPLLVGSVMSNIGYTRSVTGITAVTKVLLGYHYGILAANLHYVSSPENLSTLSERRIEILKEHAEFDRTYTAVNSLSITGINGHILLHGRYKPKDINRYKANIPRIVLLSGRQKTSVNKIIEDLKSRPIDPEEHALLHNIHEIRVPGHLGRGYAILDTNDNNETVSLREESEYFDQAKRSLWFVYSGMGSQWVGMGKELMRIPIFSAAIERCRRILEPKGIDIIDIITSDDKKTFENVLHSFVGIAAIQIGLTDVLRELDLQPDKIIGHSLGEIGCAYADGCFNVEETILSAYSRGLVSISTPLIKGSMAAVGLGYKEISKLCPPEIEVACHNSPESSTISGPAEIMSKFIDGLISQGIFAKEVQCSNMAFHSRYIADIGPPMIKHLNEIITSPKLRSARWVSTSVPQDKWDEPSAKYSSAEYHTNNVLKPVLFEEILNLIPSDAVLIEIAPHGLLQAILKRTLPETCRLIPLTRREHPSSTLFLLEAIGRLSIEGFNPKVKALYPEVEFPVSTETPMLSHLVDWAYHEKWDLHLYDGVNNMRNPAVSKFVVCTYDEENTYLKGHVIKGKNVFPFAAALVSVWDTLAMCSNVKSKGLSVEFRDLYFHSQPVLHEQRQLRIVVSLQRGTGQFEVRNENSLMLEGVITSNNTTARNVQNCPDSHTSVCAQEIYQLFLARDYKYMSEFCSLYSANETLTEGKIKWRNNWVTFIDGILQLNMLRRNHSSVSKLTFIRKLVIDVSKQLACDMKKNNDAALLEAHVLEDLERTVCGGVMIESPRFVDLPAHRDNRIALKTLKVVPKNMKTKHEDYNLPLTEEVNLESEEVLKIIKTDDSRSLHWMKAVQNKCVGVDVKVNYAGINIIYANRLLGINEIRNNDLNTNLIEFSGITKSGTRVMGIVKGDTITSSITSNSELLWPVPSHWSLEDAATVPLAYSMAFYILFIRSQLRPHHVVCVNGGGAGALGQAIITIALAHSCEVFASVGNNAKKEFLLKLFPQLKDDHIGYSRDFSFVDMVRSATKRKGCDIIISSVKGELKKVSTKCLGALGILFDMTSIQTGEDFKLGLACLDQQTSYFAVNFTSVLEQKYFPNAKKLTTMMSEGITRGYVRPLTRITFAPKDAYRAFHLQATQHNRGRVLLDLQKLGFAVLPRLACSSTSWQLIISDNEILTLKLTEKLVKRGAKKIVLLLSNLSKCAHIQSRFWRKDGIQIKLIHKNIWIESNVFDVIRNCKIESDIECVFIIISDEESLNMTEIEQKFTKIINKSCTLLKYFALVSTGKMDIIQTPVTGMLNHQNMITKIQLPEVDMKHSKELTSTNNIELTINNAVDILEELLCYKQLTIQVQINAAPKQSLLQRLLNLADISEEPENGTTNLGDLNIHHFKLLEIQIYLRHVYDVCLKIEDIKLLSKNSINELEKQLIGHNFIANKGISSYFSNTDNDELLSSTEIIYLSTLLNGEMCVDAIDASKTHITIVPGVEGHYSRFVDMCERIKIPALVLQPGLDCTNETLSELAKRYVNILFQKCNIKNNFYLLGYESGVLVALEMAAILEEKGLTGTVYCLGGSPAEILAHFKQNLSIYKTDEQLQMGVFKHLYSLMTSEDPGLLDNICKNKVWDEKIKACVSALRGKSIHTMQYAKKLFETSYARLTSLLQYTVEPKLLQSQLVSLRPQYPTSMDFTLQKYSHQKIITYQLQAPLSLATEDLMCASIINQHIDRHSMLKDLKK